MSGISIFVCGGPKTPPCSVTGCNAISTNDCGFPLGGRLTGKTCDRHLCAAHVQAVDGQELCPVHASAAVSR